MADFTVVSEHQAPKPPRSATSLSRRMARFESYLAQVKPKQVGRLAPETGESARGVALRISRAAKRAGKDVETWVVDGVTYFKHR